MGLSLVFTCGFLEVAYRQLSYRRIGLGQTWIADPDLLYALNPSARDTPGGFRGGLVTDTESLVVCLGGSTTFGHDISAGEAWPAVLDEALVRSGCAARVVNGGVPGYGSRQLLLKYRRDVAPLKPRVLVVYSVWNRTGAIVDDHEWTPEIVTRPGDTAWRRTVAFAGRHSLVARRLSTRLLDRPRRAWSPDRFHDVYRADLTTLARTAIADGVTVVIVGSPALYHVGFTDAEAEIYTQQLWGDGPDNAARLAEHSRKIATLSEIADEVGAIFENVHATVIERGQERAALFLDEMHLSTAGNRLVAERLAPTIRGAAGCGTE